MLPWASYLYLLHLALTVYSIKGTRILSLPTYPIFGVGRDKNCKKHTLCLAMQVVPHQSELIFRAGYWRIEWPCWLPATPLKKMSSQGEPGHIQKAQRWPLISQYCHAEGAVLGSPEGNWMRLQVISSHKGGRNSNQSLLEWFTWHIKQRGNRRNHSTNDWD